MDRDELRVAGEARPRRRSVWTESGSCYLLGAPAEPEAAEEEEEEGASADALAFVTRAK